MLLGTEVVGKAVTESTRESASTKAEVQVLKDMGERGPPYERVVQVFRMGKDGSSVASADASEVAEARLGRWSIQGGDRVRAPRGSERQSGTKGLSQASERP